MKSDRGVRTTPHLRTQTKGAGEMTFVVRMIRLRRGLGLNIFLTRPHSRTGRRPWHSL